jgi:hypothetical protein
MDMEDSGDRVFELNSLLERWKVYFPHEIKPTMFNVSFN